MGKTLHLGIDMGLILAYWAVYAGLIYLYQYVCQYIYRSISTSVYLYVNLYIFNTLCHTSTHSIYLMLSCLGELPGVVFNSDFVRQNNFTSDVGSDMSNDACSFVKSEGWCCIWLPPWGNNTPTQEVFFSLDIRGSFSL